MISDICLEFRKILNLCHYTNLFNTLLHNFQTAIFYEIVALQCYVTHIQGRLYLFHNSIALCFEKVIKFNIRINAILGINELSNSTNTVVIIKVMQYEYNHSGKYSFIRKSTKVFVDEYEIDHTNRTHVLNEILLLILENETMNTSIDFNNSTDGLTKEINGESFLLHNSIKHDIILNKNHYLKFYSNNTLDEF